MKYIYTKEQFLKKVNEEAGPMSNDINWGDSLIGRFINSAWRKVKIEAKSTQIPGILNGIRHELDKIKLQGMDIAELHSAKISQILFNLETFIKNSEDIDEIVKETEESIEEIKETDFKEKNELIKKLKEFIAEVNNSSSDSSSDSSSSDSSSSDSSSDSSSSDSSSDSSSSDSSSSDSSSSEEEITVSKVLGEIKYINNFFGRSNVILPIYYEYNGNLYDDKQEQVDLNDDNLINKIKNKIGSIHTSVKNGSYPFTEYHREKLRSLYPSFSSSIRPVLKTLFESFLSSRFLDLFNEIVNPSKYYLSNDRLDELVNKSKDITLEKITHESIINILKHFNRAYKIYTTDEIPSGRTDGKVSNRTKREYEELDNKKFRNKKLFNKFESGVLDIIKDPEYYDIFTNDVVAGKKGTGKILLEFITSLLDGNKLYNSGAQLTFLNKYFGIDAKGSNIGSSSSNDNRNKPEKEDLVEEKKNASFVKLIKYSEFSKDNLYYLESDNIFMFVVEEVDKSERIVKLSKQFKAFEPYFGNYKIDVSSLKSAKKEKLAEKNVDLAKIDISDIAKISGKKINIGEYIRDTSYSKVDSFELEKKANIFLLKSEDGRIANPSKRVFRERDDVEEGSTYRDLKRML